jgi:amidase
MPIEDYESHDALGLAQCIRDGETTADALLDAALERLDRLNPDLNAVVIDLRDTARDSIRQGVPDGPFAGVPFLLKDLALHLEGTRLTNGCRFYKDHVSDHDSELVARYKRAGLVIFGKSASPEFGLTTTTESILFGQTRNPWNLEHTAGGSSGGAAAAVAAGILPFANASDGGGSIRIPASCCGLFGLKPSRGRIPFGPDVGEGWSGMSTVHAVTRSVRDSAALLDCTDGPDLGAPYEAAAKARPYLDEVGAEVGALRIGLLTETFNGLPTHDDCRTGVAAAADLCQSLGHSVTPTKIEIDSVAFGTASQAIMGGNLLSTLEDYAAVIGREFGPDDVEPYSYALSQAVKQRSASDYARAIRTIHKIGRQVEAAFESFDVLLSPTMGAPPQKLGLQALSNTDMSTFGPAVLTSVGYTQAFNASGHPAASVPLHWNDAGLPIGIQFVSRLGDEATLFRLAAQLEHAQPWAQRRPSL